MTCPRALRLLLIIPASLSLSPTAFVYLDLSEPAKSIMWNLEDFIYQMPPEVIVLLSICVVKTEWDLELDEFIDVEPTFLFAAPFAMMVAISWLDETISSYRPST